MTQMVKKNLVVLLTCLVLFTMSAFALPAKAAEPEGPITVYSENGTYIGQFESYDEFIESLNNSAVMPLAYTCDTQGHVHGTAKVEKVVGYGPGYEIVAVCCKWCGGEMSRYYLYNV